MYNERYAVLPRPTGEQYDAAKKFIMSNLWLAPIFCSGVEDDILETFTVDADKKQMAEDCLSETIDMIIADCLDVDLNDL